MEVHILVEGIGCNLTLRIDRVRTENVIGIVQRRVQIGHAAVQEERRVSAAKVEPRVKVRELITDALSGSRVRVAWTCELAHNRVGITLEVGATLDRQ